MMTTKDGRCAECGQESEEYNGWPNRETWAVKLHWDNDQGDQEYFSGLAKDFKLAGKPAYAFGDALKEAYDEVVEAAFDGRKPAQLMVQDVGSAWRVDWNKIAEAYYEEVEE